MTVCGVDCMSTVPLNHKSNLKPVDSQSSSKQTLLDNTAADECVFNMTFDEDVGTVQSKKSKSTCCEFLLCFLGLQ